MLSQILRMDFLFGPKNFWSGSFETICKCQLRFFQIFAVLGTLKIIKNMELLTRMLRPLCQR